MTAAQLSFDLGVVQQLVGAPREPRECRVRKPRTTSGGMSQARVVRRRVRADLHACVLEQLSLFDAGAPPPMSKARERRRELLGDGGIADLEALDRKYADKSCAWIRRHEWLTDDEWPELVDLRSDRSAGWKR